MYYRVGSLFHSGLRHAFSVGAFLSIVFSGNAQGSKIPEGLDPAVLPMLQNAAGALPPHVIEFLRGHVKNSRTQEAMSALTKPSIVPRPLYLDITRVAELMELTFARCDQDEKDQQAEFITAMKNHTADTPPYIFVPDNMPQQIRNPIFERLKLGRLRDMKSQFERNNFRKPYLDRSLNPSELKLLHICQTNYMHLYNDLLCRIDCVKRNIGWLSALYKDLNEQNTLSNFLAPLPDFTRFNPAEALNYRSIESTLVMGRTGLMNTSVIIQELKTLYPFIMYLEKHTSKQKCLFDPIRMMLFAMESQYALISKSLEDIDFTYGCFLELSHNRTVALNDEQKVFMQDLIDETNLQHAKFVDKAYAMIITEYAGIDIEVEEYFDAVQAAKKKSQQDLKDQKKQRNQKIKEKAHETIAQAAKLSQELAQAAAEKAAAQTASQSMVTKRSKREYATNEGAFTAWYWESLKEFSLKKEARLEAQKALAKETALARSKASKNHAVDPSKVTPASASSTTSTSEPKSKIEPMVLGSNHYRKYDIFMTNKNCEYDLNDLIIVIKETLHGHVKPDRKNVTVAGYVRHIDTGAVINFSIHYHRKNGIDTLRPEQVLDIQKKLIQAGYTQDRVLKNVGRDYENTVPKSSTHNTSSTSSTSSSASSSASTSSTSQSPTSSSNNSDDDGE